MCSIIEGIKGRWYPSRNEHEEDTNWNTEKEKRQKNQARNTDMEKRNRNGYSKQHAQHAQQEWNWNWKRNRSIMNLIRKALRRNNQSGLQPSWGSTLPKSILSNTPLSINSNKNDKNNKKISDGEGSNHGRSSGKQYTKDADAQTTMKQSYLEQLMLALSLFPLPHQMGAPYFDRTDVTDFVIQ